MVIFQEVIQGYQWLQDYKVKMVVLVCECEQFEGLFIKVREGLSVWLECFDLLVIWLEQKILGDKKQFIDELFDSDFN